MEKVKLMNYNKIEIIKINEKIIKNPGNYFIFENPGIHNVYIKLNSINVFSHLFTGITNLIYIEFSDNFESSQITYMNDCFSGCTNLESIDMSKLNLENNRCFMNFFKNDKNLKEVKFPQIYIHKIIWFYRMFYGCEKLESVDMEFVYNDNGEYFYEMFKGCKTLQYINLPNFKKAYSGINKYDMFIGVPKNATILLNNNFYNSIKDQLDGYKSVYHY